MFRTTEIATAAADRRRYEYKVHLANALGTIVLEHTQEEQEAFLKQLHEVGYVHDGKPGTIVIYPPHTIEKIEISVQ